MQNFSKRSFFFILSLTTLYTNKDEPPYTKGMGPQTPIPYSMQHMLHTIGKA